MGPVLADISPHSLQQSCGISHHRKLMLWWWIHAAFLTLTEYCCFRQFWVSVRSDHWYLLLAQNFTWVRHKSSHWELAGICLFWHCSAKWKVGFPSYVELNRPVWSGDTDGLQLQLRWECWVYQFSACLAYNSCLLSAGRTSERMLTHFSSEILSLQIIFWCYLTCVSSEPNMSACVDQNQRQL